MTVKKNQKGMGLMEIVIVVGVISASFFALAQVGLMSIQAAADRSHKAQALAIAQEGIEAMRTVRDAGWASNIEVLSFGSPYYVSTSLGQWSLSLTNPGPIANMFTRTVVIENVARDINDDIVASGGTNDPGTKKITVTVTWGSPVKTMQLTTYISDILKN